MMLSPNALTLIRVFLSPFVCALALQPSFESRVAAFVLFTFAALTDLWDGYVARKQKLESNFGKILDPIADKVLVLSAMVTFSALRLYPFWLLAPILIREIFLTCVRLKFLKQGTVLAARREGKLKTNVQIVSLIFTYVYLMLRDYGGSSELIELFFLLNYFMLGVALFFTLYSGYRFFVDNQIRLDWAETLATVFYVGYLPRMPGTYGSLFALLFLLFFPENPGFYLLIEVPVLALGLWSSGAYVKKRGSHDPSEVVIDEVAGMMITFFAVPKSALTLAAGFILFRLFDVLKPPPIRRIEKLPGGAGIVLDDVAAGIYSNLILLALTYLTAFFR